uniref:NAC domain-containing protein n=1 Tax=Fagus sylvatica TaxID=28930 RepID=A0A2N9GYS6_FAGSY
MSKLPEILPPGYRFSPKDKELIELFLKPKITGKYKEDGPIPEIGFYQHEPWDLPDFSPIPRKDQEWFFFTEQDLKRQNGTRKNRATEAGYWKSTGRTPKGTGTCWVMHEYRITLKEFDGANPSQKTFVLCRLLEREDSESKSKPTLAPGDAVISDKMQIE